MKNRLLVGVFVATVLSVAALSAQPAAGTQFVLRIELQKIEGSAPPANQMMTMMVDMFRKAVLPEGSVEMQFISDGQSVRTELRGQMAMLAKGNVVLYPAGQADGYVLNPADKTYYVLKTQAPQLAAGVTLPKPELSVKPSGTYESIAGHKAEKVDIAWKMAMPVPEGTELPPGMPTDFSMDIENWCAGDMKVPASALRLMGNVAQSMPGFGLEDIAKACPFAMRSRMRMSMLPGYELRSSVISAGDAAPAPDLFKLPAGYKEVPPPRMKMPGM